MKDIKRLKMNKKIIFIVASLLFSVSFSAQMNQESREKIKSLKVAYLTEQLNLTVKEAQGFWPIYNKFDEEQHQLRNQNRSEIKKLIREKGELESVSEADAERLISLKLKNDKALYESQKVFISNVRKVIPYKKILQLQVAEMEFARKLMRKYKKRD